MEQSKKDAGTIAALMIRFKEYRLPRAQRMLDKVNDGEKLSDNDIQFLKRVYTDGRKTQPLVKRHPEYNDLISSYINLYTEIITKGLENEKTK
jgi:ribonuclease HIII